MRRGSQGNFKNTKKPNAEEREQSGVKKANFGGEVAPPRAL